jgi:Mycoplasma protein of unknown function, DUF285
MRFALSSRSENTSSRQCVDRYCCECQPAGSCMWLTSSYWPLGCDKESENFVQVCVTQNATQAEEIQPGHFLYWNVVHGTTCSRMLDGCAWFNLDVSRWDMVNAMDLSYMFLGCHLFQIQHVGLECGLHLHVLYKSQSFFTWAVLLVLISPGSTMCHGGIHHQKSMGKLEP